MFNEDLLVEEWLSIIMSKKCCRHIRPMLQIAIFFILLALPAVVQAEKAPLPLSAEDVKALIPQIEAAEKKPFNIKIESEAWVERKTSSDPCEPWQRTPIYWSSTAWSDGHSNSKMRVDINKQVLEWQDGMLRI